MCPVLSCPAAASGAISTCQTATSANTGSWCLKLIVATVCHVPDQVPAARVPKSATPPAPPGPPPSPMVIPGADVYTQQMVRRGVYGVSLRRLTCGCYISLSSSSLHFQLRPVHLVRRVLCDLRMFDATCLNNQLIPRIWSPDGAMPRAVLLAGPVCSIHHVIRHSRVWVGLFGLATVAAPGARDARALQVACELGLQRSESGTMWWWELGCEVVAGRDGTPLPDVQPPLPAQVACPESSQVGCVGFLV
jgi:hypothetical protein